MKPIFHIINCILIVSAAWFGTDILYKKVLPESGSKAEVGRLKDAPKETGRAMPGSRLDKGKIKTITRRNLFNVAVEQDEPVNESPAETSPEKLEPTHLKLSLWGTVTGGGETYAVIEDKKARQQSLYQVGDTVQGAKLKQIFRQKVVLTFNSKDQVLEMETDIKSLSSGPIRPRIAASRPSAIPRVQNLPSLEDLPANLGDIMRQIKFRPHFKDGEPDGLMVYGIRPNSIFREVGLRNGDIVKEINGTPINSTEDAAACLRKL